MEEVPCTVPVYLCQAQFCRIEIIDNMIILSHICASYRQCQLDRNAQFRIFSSFYVCGPYHLIFRKRSLAISNFVPAEH